MTTARGAIAISSDDSVVVFSDSVWRRWTFGALGAAVEPGTLVGLLTPPTAIAALCAGYRPIHTVYRRAQEASRQRQILQGFRPIKQRRPSGQRT